MASVVHGRLQLSAMKLQVLYTFTPSAGQCAVTTSFTVTVNENIVPSFSFGTELTICEGATVPSLPATSLNGISGSWSPSIVSNEASGTYTFTPSAGQCAVTTSFTVTVNENIVPSFSFGTELNICEGATVPSLPAISQNSISGSWSPSSVSNEASGTYTFTPSAGQCAVTTSFTVTVNENIVPSFSFGTELTICEGATVPSLPATSLNGISGSWSLSTVSNETSGTYTFTPSAGQCAVTTSFTVTVNENIVPSFSFGTELTICEGATVPSLPATSLNGISGSWSPSSVSNETSGLYTFTPSAGQCVLNSITFTVTIIPVTIPVFSFGTELTICAGSDVPDLPTTSDNGINGNWNQATVNNQASGVYTFTPEPIDGACFATALFTVTVNQLVKPEFSFGNEVKLCSGSTAFTLPASSVNGINGTWQPAIVSNVDSGFYIFTPSPGQCALDTASVNVSVLPVPTVNGSADTIINDGNLVPVNYISGTPGNISFNWTNSNPSIGLPASGTGYIPSFIAINNTNNPVIGTITIIPVLNGCVGASTTYLITVKPLNKDVFVPNVFSPNGDGKNDILYVYGNYIEKLEMRIFNQWGEQVEYITDKSRGWDGKHRGKHQPVGVYVYSLKAVLKDGKTIQLKGSITLIR
jgi:large repetitive protein